MKKFKKIKFLVLIASKYVVVFALFSCLMACQKEAITDFTTEVHTTKQVLEANEMIPNPVDLATAIDLSKVIPEKEYSNQATSRSATTLINSINGSVTQNGAVLYYVPKQSLPDPRIYKFEANLKPHSGDPDLIIYGYDAENPGQLRVIRASDNFDLNYDHETFRSTDLKKYGITEEGIYIGVYGFRTSSYTLDIYQTTVDCVEHPAADQTTSLLFAPVCGCDGVEYGNSEQALNQGVTQWTSGPCNSGNLITYSDHFGGNGGDHIDLLPPGGANQVKRISGFAIGHGQFVQSIQVEFELLNGQKVWSDHAGSQNPDFVNIIQLSEGEYITKITGGAGRFVDRLTFHTNLGKKYGAYGGDGGQPFTINAPNGPLGLFCHAGTLIDSFGAIGRF